MKKLIELMQVAGEATAGLPGGDLAALADLAAPGDLAAQIHAAHPEADPAPPDAGASS